MAASFCAKCIGESSEETAGSYREGPFGREFRGRARPCPDRGSHVSTLWRQFLYVPTVPVGTYRYLHAAAGFGGTKFFSRRVAADAEQVRKTRITGTLLALLVLGVAAYFLWRKYR